LRAALNTLATASSKAIDDRTLMTIAASKVRATHGKIHGEAIVVPVLEAPGQNRVGRFGWKDQPQLSAFLHRRCLFERDGRDQPLAADRRDDHRQSDGRTLRMCPTI